MSLSILDACRDPKLFGPWFKDAETWMGWFAFLNALFGLPMDSEQQAIYRQCTGRTDEPVVPFSEAWLVVGRRGGKSFIAALVAVFLAAFKDYRPHLAPGEVATILVVAADRKQARTIHRYASALLNEVPLLRGLVVKETSEVIELCNRSALEVCACNFRSIRGRSVAAAILDEVAFWRADESSATPDHEVLTAIKPSMATFPQPVLLGLSSPYAQRGILWQAFKRHHGVDGSDVLVWQADTRTMNPAVPPRVIERAFERDPVAAAAEYGAQFRSDVESFVSRQAVEANVVEGRHELPPLQGVRYSAFTDPSGGSRDSFTLAIGHREADLCVVDALRERKPPFRPDEVVREFAQLLRRYRVSTVTGDRYAGEWPRERFRVHGIHYRPAAQSKSVLYGEMLPILNTGAVELLDTPRLVAQVCGLERRTARGGRDSIDHAPGGHDDVVNVVAGLLAELSGGGRADLAEARRQLRRISHLL